MKQFWREVGLSIVLGMMMPALILHIVTYSSHRHVHGSESTQEPSVAAEEPVFISVLNKNGVAETMELEEYLVGVVLAEMPASFEVEALKAQAVVARTYTLRAHEGKSKHDAAAVCTDSACCQAYRSPEDYLNSSGSQENVDKVTAAVQSTAGLVLIYKGELIEATYFSCSGGSTEDAVAVWGAEIPYLQAVSSPGEENAAHYSDSVSFTAEVLAEALGISPAGSPEDWFGDVTYTAGGGVDTIQIGGTTYSGTGVRKLLGLRSTAFTVTVEAASITFHTRGFGHRVGMSQYGADAMAAMGSSFEEILQHYYQGTVLELHTD